MTRQIGGAALADSNDADLRTAQDEDRQRGQSPLQRHGREQSRAATPEDDDAIDHKKRNNNETVIGIACQSVASRLLYTFMIGIPSSLPPTLVKRHLACFQLPTTFAPIAKPS
jgi:hypothetical protein